MELLKSITRYKLRRARQAAAAARFFDESVRNSYARRATTPQTALRRQGEFRAEARKRWRRCVTLVRTPVASVSGAQQKGHGGEGNFGRQGEKDPADAEVWGAAQPNKNAGVFIRRQGSVSGAQQIKIPQMRCGDVKRMSKIFSKILLICLTSPIQIKYTL